jgi:hypothetical protein
MWNMSLVTLNSSDKCANRVRSEFNEVFNLSSLLCAKEEFSVKEEFMSVPFLFELLVAFNAYYEEHQFFVIATGAFLGGFITLCFILFYEIVWPRIVAFFDHLEVLCMRLPYFNLLIDFFSVYCIEPCYVHVMGGRSRRYVEGADLKIQCGNRTANFHQIRRFYSSNKLELRLYGSTTCGEYVFDFPVYCDPGTVHRFIKFLREYDRRGPEEHREVRRFCEGQLTPYLKQEARVLFAPIIGKVTGWSLFPEDSKVPIMLGSSVGFFLGSFTSVFPFILFTSSLKMAANSLVYVFCEEVFNGYFGVMPIIAYETSVRMPNGFAMNGLVALMHLGVCSFPLPIRILIHFAWNLAAIRVAKLFHPNLFVTGGTTSEMNEKYVKACFGVVDLLNKMCNKDIVGLLCVLGSMNARQIASFLETVGLFSVEEVDLKWLDDILAEEEDVPLGSFRELMFEWIPRPIRHSPTFSKVAALAMMFFSSQFFGSSGILCNLRGSLTPEDFTDRADMYSTVVGAVVGVLKGAKRSVEEGNWRAFFDLPRDVIFADKATALLFDGGKGTTAEIEAQIAEARTLVEGRRFLNNTIEQQRLRDKLLEFVKSQRQFLKSQSFRRAPFMVSLIGPPGTGKTQLLSACQNWSRKRAGKEKRAGDVAIVDVESKYPTESNVDEDVEYLVTNDAPAIYTEFPKMDKMPLDIMLQRILDIFPLSFRAAAVEDKGKVLNNVKQYFFTSNNYSFKCPGETKKLHRRMRKGFHVEVSVVVDGQERSFEEFEGLPQEKRNDCWRFTELLTDCLSSDNFILYKKTKKVMNLAEFFETYERKLTMFEQAQSRESELFDDDEGLCPCGIPKVLHLGVHNDKTVGSYGHRANTYRMLSSRCVYDPEEADGYDPFVSKSTEIITLNNLKIPEVAGGVRLIHIVFPMFIWLFISCFFWDFAFSLVWLGLCLACLWMSDFDFQYYLVKFVSQEFEQYNDWVVEKMFLSDRVEAIVKKMSNQRGGAITYALFKCKQYYLRLKRFFLDYWKVIAAGVISVGLYDRYRKHILLAKPIFPEQVDPKTMNIFSYSSQPSFPLEKRREWSKADTESVHVKVQKVGVGLEDLKMMIKNNMSKVELLYDGNVAEATILFVTPEFFLLNKHYVFKDGKWLPKTGYFQIVYRGNRETFHCSDLLGDDSSEVFLIRHFFDVLHKSLQSFMPEEDVGVAINICRVGADDTFEGVGYPTRFKADKTYDALVWGGDKVVPGMCMEPVIGKIDGTSFLVGIVSFGRESWVLANQTGCSLLSKAWFTRILAKQKEPMVGDAALLGAPIEIQPLSLNAELRNVPTSCIAALGSSSEKSREFTTAFRKTVLYPAFSPMLSQEYGAPKKLKTVNDGVYRSAFTNTFKNVGKSNNLKISEIKTVVAQMVERNASEKLVEERNVKLSPISFSEAIFGKPELGIERIDFKTSSGPLLRDFGIKNKYDMFVPVDSDGYIYALDENVMDLVKGYDDVYKRGDFCVPFVDMVPKDEVRPEVKLIMAKIRLFCVLCAAFNIYIRMYMMPLIVYLLQYRVNSECYGAMNAASAEWNELANRMKKEGFFNFDMDFETFDVSHDGKMFYAGALFYYLLALRLGYPEEAAEIVYRIVISFRWQLGRYMADYFLKFKGMPSGVIFTLIFNSFVNSFLLRVAYLRLVGPLNDFQEKVETANVGDDNINAVHRELREKFNMITIAVEYARMGYVATPAKKGNETQAEIPFEDLTFLKRSFVWSSELKSYVAPIDPDSIYKAFCFEKKESGISPPERLRDVSRGAQREAFLHGREFFDNFQVKCGAAFDEAGLRWESLDYEVLKIEYLDGVFRTFAA